MGRRFLPGVRDFRGRGSACAGARGTLAHFSSTFFKAFALAVGMTDENLSRRCAGCGDRIAYGMNALSLVEGVIGPRGLVPLAEPSYFCGHECLGLTHDFRGAGGSVGDAADGL